MQITSFEEAIQFVGFAKQMRHDLPDGQWGELKAVITDYVESYGKDTTKWNEDVKAYFTDDVRENYWYWM